MFLSFPGKWQNNGDEKCKVTLEFVIRIERGGGRIIVYGKVGGIEVYFILYTRKVMYKSQGPFTFIRLEYLDFPVPPRDRKFSQCLKSIEVYSLQEEKVGHFILMII